MQACSAPVVCPAALARCDWVGHGMRWRCLLCARHRLTPEFLPPLNQVRNTLLDKLTSNGNKSQRFVIIEIWSPLGTCFLENPLVRIWQVQQPDPRDLEQLGELSGANVRCSYISLIVNLLKASPCDFQQCREIKCVHSDEWWVCQLYSFKILMQYCTLNLIGFCRNKSLLFCSTTD